MAEREWFSLTEAAGLLGVSQRTVRRWVHAGRLEAELRPARNGPQYFIHADELARVERRQRRTPDWASAADLNGMTRALDELVERLSALQREHASLKQEYAELRALLAQGEPRLPELSSLQPPSARRSPERLDGPDVDGPDQGRRNERKARPPANLDSGADVA